MYVGRRVGVGVSLCSSGVIWRGVSAWNSQSSYAAAHDASCWRSVWFNVQQIDNLTVGQPLFFFIRTLFYRTVSTAFRGLLQSALEKRRASVPWTLLNHVTRERDLRNLGHVRPSQVTTLTSAGTPVCFVKWWAGDETRRRRGQQPSDCTAQTLFLLITTR